MAVLTKVEIIKNGFSFVKGNTVGVDAHTAEKLERAGVGKIVGSVKLGSDAPKKKQKESVAKENKAMKKSEAKTK